MADRSLPRWDSKQIWGFGLAVIGISIPVVLAFLGSREKPPSASIQGMLALVSVASQLGAGWSFKQVGVVDSSHFVRAVKRLEKLRQRSGEARQVAEQMVDDLYMDVGSRKAALGEMSVWLSVVQEEVVEAMEDWQEAMPAAAAELESRARSKGDAQ